MAFDLHDLKRRARGSLIGAAVGDAMGAPVEGMTSAAIREQHGAITGFLTDEGGGTDDTDFTLFNAYILLTHGVDVTPDVVETEWRDKLLSGRYTYRPGGFSDVISTRNLQAGLHAPYSGAFNHQMWSDGVAMAISSAGVVCPGDPAKAAQIAAALGSVSNGRDGIYTAQAVAAAISMAMVGATPDEMFDAALENVPRDSWTFRALARSRQTVESVAFVRPTVSLTRTGNTGMLSMPGRSIDDALARIEDEVIVQWWAWADLATEAIPAAMGVFLATGGEASAAIPAAIRLGRDADTMGAIVGSLCGAFGGEHSIPEAWRHRVDVSTGKCIGFVAGQRISEVADRLAEMAHQRTSA